MELKERLELLRLNNEFRSYSGIKSFRIASIKELSEKEKNILRYIDMDINKAIDKMELDNNRKKYFSWAKEKIIPYISCDIEIIIVHDDRLVYMLFEDIEIFLQQYLENENFDICIINRELKKCISLSMGEYYVEYYNEDI